MSKTVARCSWRSGQEIVRASASAGLRGKVSAKRGCRAACGEAFISPRKRKFLSSSAVEQSAVNRSVVGSIPTSGAPPPARLSCRLGSAISVGTMPLNSFLKRGGAEVAKPAPAKARTQSPSGDRSGAVPTGRCRLSLIHAVRLGIYRRGAEDAEAASDGECACALESSFATSAPLRLRKTFNCMVPAQDDGTFVGARLTACASRRSWVPGARNPRGLNDRGAVNEGSRGLQSAATVGNRSAVRLSLKAY